MRCNIVLDVQMGYKGLTPSKSLSELIDTARRLFTNNTVTHPASTGRNLPPITVQTEWYPSCAQEAHLVGSSGIGPVRWIEIRVFRQTDRSVGHDGNIAVGRVVCSSIDWNRELSRFVRPCLVSGQSGSAQSAAIRRGRDCVFLAGRQEEGSRNHMTVGITSHVSRWQAIR